MSNEELQSAVADAIRQTGNPEDHGYYFRAASAALDAVASHFDLCREDWETLPCLTCGAGL